MAEAVAGEPGWPGMGRGPARRLARGWVGTLDPTPGPYLSGGRDDQPLAAPGVCRHQDLLAAVGLPHREVRRLAIQGHRADPRAVRDRLPDDQGSADPRAHRGGEDLAGVGRLDVDGAVADQDVGAG